MQSALAEAAMQKPQLFIKIRLKNFPKCLSKQTFIDYIPIYEAKTMNNRTIRIDN